MRSISDPTLSSNFNLSVRILLLKIFSDAVRFKTIALLRLAVEIKIFSILCIVFCLASHLSSLSYKDDLRLENIAVLWKFEGLLEV